MATKSSADAPEFVFHSKESAEAYAEPDDAYGIHYTRADSEELVRLRRIADILGLCKQDFLTGWVRLHCTQKIGNELDALLSAQSKVGEG